MVEAMKVTAAKEMLQKIEEERENFAPSGLPLAFHDQQCGMADPEFKAKLFQEFHDKITALMSEATPEGLIPWFPYADLVGVWVHSNKENDTGGCREWRRFFCDVWRVAVHSKYDLEEERELSRIREIIDAYEKAANRRAGVQPATHRKMKAMVEALRLLVQHLPKGTVILDDAQNILIEGFHPEENLRKELESGS